MSETLARIRTLIAAGDFRISDHAYRQILERELIIEQLVESARHAEIVEDYPDFHKGPSVLILSRTEGQAVHMVWGIPKNQAGPAWLVTAYVPDRQEWMPDNKTRRRK